MKKDYFTLFADKVSSGMGTPLNIAFWMVVVLFWFLLFATHPTLQDTNVLPAWFTSNSFNFPLNTVTTLAELYIGFLVAAAANRVERHNQEQMERIERLEEKVAHLVEEQNVEHGRQFQELHVINLEQKSMLLELMQRR